MPTLSFSFYVPNSVPHLQRIEIGSPSSDCYIELDFTEGHTNYLEGINPVQFANIIVDAINFSSTNATIIDARTNRNIVAVARNQLVEIEMQAGAECCGLPILIKDEYGLSTDWTPRGGLVSECEDFDPTLSEIDCTNPDYQYKHVFRFQFVDDGSVIYGNTGTDYRMVIDPTYAIIPCYSAPLSLYDTRLSPYVYANFDEFVNGWARTMNDVYWSVLYGGTVVHLGNGVIEVITDLPTWWTRFPVSDPESESYDPEKDICIDGLGLNCTYSNTVVNPNLEWVYIAQGCCIPVPETPPPDPVIDPETDQPPPILNDREYALRLFACCGINGAPGIRRLIAMDALFYRGVCLDADGVIDSVLYAGEYWAELCTNIWGMSLTVTQQLDEQGFRFENTLPVTINVMRQLHRNGIMHLLYRPLVVIIQDMNNRYWFLGEYFPVRARQNVSTTGALTSGSSQHKFTLVETNYHHPREINKAFIEGDAYRPPLNVASFVDCSTQYPQGDTYVNPLRNCFINPFANNFIND